MLVIDSICNAFCGVRLNRVWYLHAIALHFVVRMVEDTQKLCSPELEKRSPPINLFGRFPTSVFCPLRITSCRVAEVSALRLSSPCRSQISFKTMIQKGLSMGGRSKFLSLYENPENLTEHPRPKEPLFKPSPPLPPHAQVH